MKNFESTESFEPAGELHITDIEVLKVLSDPLRARILDLARAQVQTVKQLAAAVNLPPKRLYYHINLMEQHGLLRVVGTRLVSGILEKSYRATAYLFLFDQEVFASTDTSGETPPIPALRFTFESAKNQLQESIAQGLVDLSPGAPLHRSLLSMWNMNRLAREQAEAFYSRLAALLEEFQQQLPAQSAAQSGETPQDYRIFLMLFPVQAFLDKPGQTNPPKEK